MNSTPTIRALVLAASVLGLTVGSTFAQQVTGTPGSPSATTTIDGRYLPNPPPTFGGEIGLDAKDLKPFWPPQVQIIGHRIPVMNRKGPARLSRSF